MSIEKQVFLVCYDYGMGGLWATFVAQSRRRFKISTRAARGSRAAQVDDRR